MQAEGEAVVRSGVVVRRARPLGSSAEPGKPPGDVAGLGHGRVEPHLGVGPVRAPAPGRVAGAGQVFAARYTRAALARSDDPAVRTLDADAVLNAAVAELPPWVRPVVVLRFGLVTVGSPLVIVLLALPSAGSYFH